MMNRIILDTDFETDCDDVAALCVLLNLHERGEVKIEGVIASICSPEPASSIRAFLLAAGHPEIPLGANRRHADTLQYRIHRENAADLLYNRVLRKICPESAPENFVPEDGENMYRRILENAEDNSVTICSIGLLTELAALMKSPGGIELVRRKVRKLVSMAEANAPEGHPGFNWEMNAEAAAFVVSSWPGILEISSEGRSVYTGGSLSCLSENNLERAAYECFGKTPGFLRPSWDQIAVLASAEKKEYVGEIFRGKILTDGKHHRWEKNESGPHACLGLVRSVEETAAYIEELMNGIWINNRDGQTKGKQK